MADITRGVRLPKRPRNPGQVDLVEQVLAYDSYTKAILHFNGADGSTTFTDEIGNVWTGSGNAQIDTAQSKFGGASALSDGTGDYIIGSGSSNFGFGTGDWTIDFWVRFSAVNRLQLVYDARPPATPGDYNTIYVLDTNKIVYNTNGLDRITSTTNMAINTWYHIAVARSGTSTKMFINGTQEGGTFTDTINYLIPANRPMLLNGYDSNYSMAGWMDELRISKGIARWTTNFTPPTSEY